MLTAMKDQKQNLNLIANKREQEIALFLFELERNKSKKRTLPVSVVFNKSI